jgi:hypothetical protein
MRSHSCNAMVETIQPKAKEEAPEELGKEEEAQTNPELVADNVRKDAVTT